MANKNKIDLSDQSGLVTGAATGLGYGIAQRLIESGARIAVWDVNKAGLDAAVEKLGTIGGKDKVVGVVSNIADAKFVEDGVAATLKAFGAIDICVNNAGISGPNTVTWEYPIDAWKQVVDINLTGTFLVSRAVIPHMRAKNYGRIVNVASVAGKEGNPNAPAYSATKAGVIGLTKTIGKELATTGITCNCVTPAAVRTALFDQMTQAHVDFMLSKIPMNRFGTTEEIAALVAWLCSPECSFSTGAVFDLSGGRATY
jgi:2-dehydro-3-deoxy-L-rhamnonate dehydrogenase (NAD+)